VVIFLPLQSSTLGSKGLIRSVWFVFLVLIKVILLNHSRLVSRSLLSIPAL